MARTRPSSRTQTPTSAPARTPWLAIGLLVLLGAAVYANALGGPLVLDDQRSVRENPTIQSLSDLGRVLHPPLQSPMTGRPIPNVTLAVNYAISGDAVRSYRVVNIAIHILAALVLFAWLRLTLARVDAGRAATGHADGPALAVAALWLVHPINSETVNYLTQRTESLMGLFVLTSLWAAARALGTRRPLRWELVAIGAAFCAVGSKETALLLPLLLALWDRVFAFDSWAGAWAARRRLYLGVTASWLVFAIFARELPFFVEKGFQEHVSRLDYLLHQGPVVLRYLGLTAWPQNLVFDYGAPGPVVLSAVLPAVAVVAALGGATLLALARWPRVGFWGAWFFITLAPASSFIPIPTEVAAERRMYLPVVAVLVLAVLLVRHLLARVDAPTLRARLAVGVTAVLVVLLGATTLARNRDYQDALRLWQTSLDRWPQARAHEHLSMAYRDLGRIDDSLKHLRLAAPESPNARHALASLLLERGELQESITQFREYIRLRPDDPNIILGREEFGIALLRARDWAGAAEQFRAIVALNPDYARARVGLGDALVQLNQPAAALEAYREAVRIQPDNVPALLNLSILQRAAGDATGAIASLKALVRVEPGHVPARRQLVQLLLATRDYTAAEPELRALIALTPEDPAAYNLLGLALVSRDQTAAARAAFEQALKVAPGFTEARQNLARLR
ncbi:MAG: tetratricopeptide repeat protein [Vicinamibacterales bacterium]